MFLQSLLTQQSQKFGDFFRESGADFAANLSFSLRTKIQSQYKQQD